MKFLLCLFIFTVPLAAQVRNPGEETLSPDLDSSIARALSYLARQQQPDGSFLNREKSDEKTPRFSGQKIPLTSLSLLAFLSTGRMPDVGKHGMVVRNAIDYLIKACPDDGYFGKVDSSQMIGHAIATFALAEVYGMEADANQRKKLRTVLDKSLKVLLSAQNNRKDDKSRGGWRNDINPGDGDLFVTTWCILALRASSNAGLNVPREPADRAAAFVLACWRAKQNGFSNDQSDNITPASNAAGLLDLFLLGQSGRPEITPAATWLRDHPIEDNIDPLFFSRQFAVLAAFQAGGETWRTTWERYQSKILQSQQKDGAWPPSRSAKEPGQTYSTVLSVLTLSTPLRLLPAIQR